MSDDWQGDGITFKVATDRRGLIIEPEEGSGELPRTFVTSQQARLDLAAIRRAEQEIRDVSPESYLADYIGWIADDLQSAIARLSPDPASEGQQG